MQTLTVSLNVPITVPEDMVLVEKVEYEELKRKSNKDLWWSMSDLEEKLKYGHVWIKDNILYPTKFKEILDVKNGGCVVYPEKKGEAWVFQAKRMELFLEEYFADIYTR